MPSVISQSRSSFCSATLHAQARDDPARLEFGEAGVNIGHLHSVFSIGVFAGM